MDKKIMASQLMVYKEGVELDKDYSKDRMNDAYHNFVTTPGTERLAMLNDDETITFLDGSNKKIVVPKDKHDLFNWSTGANIDKNTRVKGFASFVAGCDYGIEGLDGLLGIEREERDDGGPGTGKITKDGMNRLGVLKKALTPSRYRIEKEHYKSEERNYGDHGHVYTAHQEAYKQDPIRDVEMTQEDIKVLSDAVIAHGIHKQSTQANELVNIPSIFKNLMTTDKHDFNSVRKEAAQVLHLKFTELVNNCQNQQEIDELLRKKPALLSEFRRVDAKLSEKALEKERRAEQEKQGGNNIDAKKQAASQSFMDDLGV